MPQAGIRQRLSSDMRETKIYPLRLMSMDEGAPPQYPEAKGGVRYQRSNSLTSRKDRDEEADLEELSRPSSILARFAERSSMMGVIYIHTTSSRLGRALWVLLLLGAMAGLAVHTYLLISTFYSFETFAKVQMGYDNLQFPAVTVCNINPIRSSKKNETQPKLQKLINSFSPEQLLLNAEKEEMVPGEVSMPAPVPTGAAKEAASALLTSIAQSTSAAAAAVPAQSTSAVPDATAELPTSAKPVIRGRRAIGEFSNYTFSGLVLGNSSRGQPPSSWEQEGTQTTAALLQEEFELLYSLESRGVRQRIAHQKNALIQECSFSGRQCHPQNFTFRWDPKYGSCYTLQYENFVSLDSGPSGGLELLLFLETSEYLRGLTNGNGLQVVIHEQNRVPFPEREGFAVSAGTETFVPLKLQQVTRLQSPYGSCEPGTTFENSYNTKYTRQLCQQVCQVQAVVNNCSCYEGKLEEAALLLGVVNTTKQCRSDTDLECVANISMEFRRDKSICGCESPCTQKKYIKTSVSSRQWPSREYAEVLAKSMCKKEFTSFCSISEISDSFGFGKNFVKLNIYYEDLNYDNVTDTASYELTQFASDVGGTMGLWIGLSVLSVFEVWQLLMELCLAFTVHRAARRESMGDREKR